MGRPRKTVEEHLASGTYRADRHGPIPMGCSPVTKPKTLSPEASKFWDAVIADRLGTLTAGDVPAAVCMAEAWAVWRQTCDVYHAVKTAGERLRLTKLVADTSAAFERWAKRFGLTPADRAKARPTETKAAAAKVAVRPKTHLDRLGAPK